MLLSAGRLGRVGGTGKAPLPIRLIGTRTRQADQFNAAMHYMNSRSPHEARSDLTRLAPILPNWYYDQTSQTEHATGGTATYTAAVEYPAGTITPITFGGGNASVTVGDGLDVTPDLCTVAIPNGATYWIRVFGVFPGGIVYNVTHRNVAAGQLMEFSATPIADKTLGGTITQSGASVVNFVPLAIIGPSSSKAVLCFGDSRVAGNGDTADANCVLGEQERAVWAANLAYTKIGSPSDTAQFFPTRGTRRALLFKYATSAICNYGVNDMPVSPSLSTMQARLQALWALFSCPVWQTTIAPSTTSTDSWATTANQTSRAGFTPTGSSVREQLNDWIRTVPAGLRGYFDNADKVESARNSGLWQVNGAANYFTADGLHEAQAGHIAANTCIDTAVLA